ncbi:MAG TPA: hypothetical protein VMI55_07600 [Thermoplasmata archaeon]|nr:hypothetical protein [Thermoplasmata archaeon]
MRSRPGRSTAPSPRRPAKPGRVDVYLFPAVIGGGLGDIEETLAAGRRLAAAGWTPRLYRHEGRPLPREVSGPWDWPVPLERVDRLDRRAPAALTITPAWGVSAAPGRSGAMGRPGPWAEEADEVERAYGSDSTVHVSLEEFARTLSVARENRERLREGGVSSRAMAGRLRASVEAGEEERFRKAFERFRAFDRPNVLHLFATFRRDPRFAREFPTAVQTGPLWPHRYRPVGRAPPPARGREWVWYASPASAERIAPEVLHGLATVKPPVRLLVRTPRPWKVGWSAGELEVRDHPLPAAEWTDRFRGAELRIVTGSRTLLEALEVGGPFLYFNGVLGRGSATRRHRPEKVAAWLEAERAQLPSDLRRDLADFARGRRVRAVVRRAAERTGGWRRFPRGGPAPGFRPPFDDAGELIEKVARALAGDPRDAPEIVRRVRAGLNP